MSVSQTALGRELGVGLFSRQRVTALALGVLALLLVFLIAHDVLFPAAPAAAALRSSVASVGSVRSLVSGTGTVVPVEQQNLNFTQSGTLTEVDVKVGDQVKQGQTLAKLDPTQLQQALNQANNNLTQAQSTLNNTLNGNAVTQAQHSLAAAQQSLSDTQAQVNLTNQQDANNVANDQTALGNDQNNYNSANASLQSANTTYGPMVSADKSDLAAKQTKYQLDNCSNPANSGSQLCQQDFVAIQQAQAKLNQDQAPISAAQAAFNQAQSAVNTDQTRLTTDQNKQAADQVSNQRSIDQANNSVTSAQDALDSQTIQRPNTIASQEASVANDQLAVQTAQRNLSAATLTAPLDGTIMSVSGQAGESVSGGGAGATTQAPGSTAPQPNSSGGTSSGAGGTGSGSGGAFITLGNVSGLEVVAPFAEADAARLAASQTATVTFDAITGLSLPAHVLAVAASATVISNVTNYYATLVLDQVDRRLKSGMTANASVIVQQVQGVLTVPNAAITRLGGSAFVTLLGRDGKTETRQPVQVGAIGDSTTQVVSGLNVGDRIVLPQLRVPTTGTTGGRGGGFGGGGGVRVGGG